MATLYESIKTLCDLNKIKPSKMCVELGISKSMMTKLKNGTKQSIQIETAQKIAEYFGVSVDRVLGSEQKEKSPMSEDTGLNSEFINLFNQLSPEDQAREIAYLRERVSGQDK